MRESDRFGTSLLTSGAWFALSRVIWALALFATNAQIARSLAPAEFGQYSLSMAAVIFGTIVVIAGLNRTLVRHVAEHLALNEYHKAVIVVRRGLTLFFISLLIMSPLFFLILSVGSFTFQKSPLTFLETAIATFLVVTIAVQQLSSELIRAYGNLKAASFFLGQLGGPFANTLFLLLLLIAPSTLTSSLSGVLLLQALAVLVTVPVTGLWLVQIISRTKPASTENDSDQIFKETPTSVVLMFDTIPLCLAQLVTAVVIRCDIIIGAAVLSETDLALYGACSRLLFFLTAPIIMVNQIILTSVSVLHARGEHQKLQQLVQRAAAIAGIPSLIAGVLIIIFRVPLLSLVYGPFYAKAATTLGILTLGQMVAIWTGGCLTVLLMTGQQRLVLLVNTITAIVFILFSILAGSNYGINGLALVASTIVASANIALWTIARIRVSVWTNIPVYRLHDLSRMIWPTQNR